MKFRKKPVVIEAFQYNPTEIDGQFGLNMPEEFLSKLVITPGEAGVDYGCGILGKMVQIRTLEGMMKVSPADWIIKGVKGEFYPCKPDIFDATYEVAE